MNPSRRAAGWRRRFRGLQRSGRASRPGATAFPGRRRRLLRPAFRPSPELPKAARPCAEERPQFRAGGFAFGARPSRHGGGDAQGNLSQSLRHPDTPSPRRSALHGGGVQDRAERGPAAGGGQGRPALAEPDRPLECGRALPLRGLGEDRPKTPRQRLDMAADLLKHMRRKVEETFGATCSDAGSVGCSGGSGFAESRGGRPLRTRIRRGRGRSGRCLPCA